MEDKQAEVYGDCPHGRPSGQFCNTCLGMEMAERRTKEKLRDVRERVRDGKFPKSKQPSVDVRELVHHMELDQPKPDPVNHPSHYTKHPSGVECITVTEHMNFNVGNAIKYLWRAGSKNNLIEDLKKARWYVDREILRQSTAQN